MAPISRVSSVTSTASSALEKLICPPGYKSTLTLLETEFGIKHIKDFFEKSLSEALGLVRVSAPLFVCPESGLNDNLNGYERPVRFDVPCAGKEIEIVHSLAKWKRMALKRYNFTVNTGLLTDMNAIRRDEETDNLHSIYVDQWDWEAIITQDQRTCEFLHSIVSKIYHAFSKTYYSVEERFPKLKENEGRLILPEKIFFITSQELENMYPEKTPKERENLISKQHYAVFISQIGGNLESGTPHDGRAPDYDDWEMNGDILIWYPLLDEAVEISSMGIRVNEETLAKQLKIKGCEERASMEFHRLLLSSQLPLSIGGGLGQSRICMLMLHKAHIGEVQSSIWPDEMVSLCQDNNVFLL